MSDFLTDPNEARRERVEEEGTQSPPPILNALLMTSLSAHSIVLCIVLHTEVDSITLIPLPLLKARCSAKVRFIFRPTQTLLSMNMLFVAASETWERDEA